VAFCSVLEVSVANLAVSEFHDIALSFLMLMLLSLDISLSLANSHGLRTGKVAGRPRLGEAKFWASRLESHSAPRAGQ
jgi:hypothetical protein